MKKGEFLLQKKKHLANQKRQDAINLLKIGETVEITAYTDAGYKKFTARPIKDADPTSGDWVIAFLEGKICATQFIDKNGFKVKCIRGKGYYHIRSDKIFGVVI